MKNLKTVSIKFRPRAYGVYRSLQNKVWYALSEYIDNALQSYLKNKRKILQFEKKYKFKVELEINRDEDYIRIYDNAGGIDVSNFARAFEPANIPVDISGLSEFGMGMKIASIWFADEYVVRTSAIGEKIERKVSFNLNKVIKDEKEVLDVLSSKATLERHFTEVTLKRLSRNAPSVFQLNKIKAHLASIYRKYLRNSELTLIVNGEELIFEEPEVLVAPFYKNMNGRNKLWKKEINVKVGSYKIKGFIALLKEMSAINSGFSLFRRNRVIEGSHDEKFHPKVLCGHAGSPRDKRIFGELELEGVDVSFNKGSFQGLEEIEPLLEIIKTQISQNELNIIKQADEYRKYKSASEIKKVAKKVAIDIKKEAKTENYKKKIEDTIKKLESTAKPAEQALKTKSKIEAGIEDITLNKKNYRLKMDIIYDKGYPNMYSLLVKSDNSTNVELEGKINFEHSFFKKNQIYNLETFKPFISIIKALMFSEIFASSQGTKNGGNIRINFNKFIESL